MPLITLPVEIISQLSFNLIALDPLGTPNALISLALTCRFWKNIVTSNPFLAKVCRLKFDIAPIKRRCFNPRDRDLADELVRCCLLLQDIRRADFSPIDSYVDDTMPAAYLLMLSNDGKNYAQLEHAGIDAYVDKYLRTKLWEGRETNQGWPLDATTNSSALWLMWMTLTKQKLLQESPAAREEMMLLTLPYVVLPHRYSSALAPPNHFNLPLDSANPYHQQPLVTTLSPSTPYPIYMEHSLTTPYFNGRFSFSSPLITVAAKLLFVARKELFPIRAPPHLPQAPAEGVTGITQEDFREFNRHPAAKLCRLVSWDWLNGCPILVGGDDQQIGDGWEESKVWDTEWWRRLLCGDCRLERPKYLPGDLFKFGSMRGSWQGREYLPQGNLFIHFLRHPDAHYPGIPDEHHPHLFTEASIGLSMKPVFLDIQEHHKICECPLDYSHSNNDAHPYTPASSSFAPNSNSTPNSLPVEAQTQIGRCGVVPVPAPLVFVSVHPPMNAEQDENIQVDDPDVVSDAVTLSLPSSEIKIDYSMSNAWFPGHVGGVSFTKLPTTTNAKRRENVVCAVDFQAPDVRNALTRPEEGECLALGGRRLREEKMNGFVYETYDPEKTSSHRGLETTCTANANANANTSDPDKCARCIQREVLIRQERKKAEERSKKMLDRGMRSYGRDWEEEEEEEEEEGMDEEGDEGEDMELEDMDVTGLNIDLDGIDRLIADATTTTTNSSSALMVFGDDRPYGEPGLEAHDANAIEETMDGQYNHHQPTPFGRSKRIYDKCRIGVECTGVGDVLLSGETGPRHAVWQQYTMYGRVRPWDGLIGILRSSNANNTTNNIFIFGYIVGEHNFVGEWRVAASDPLRPTWGSAFVMSRRATTTTTTTPVGGVPV